MNDLPSVISIVGDCFLLETLANAAKCSRGVKKAVVPVLKRKMDNEDEMFQLLSRILPALKHLPAVELGDKTAEYYRSFLERMHDAEEMRQLVLRVFPGIVNLPANETAGYYRRLLDSYYYHLDPEWEPVDIEVSLMVGSINTAPNPFIEAQGFMMYVPKCANTAVKRARVLKAIGEWTTIYTKRGVSIGADFTDAITKLDALALALRTDFAVYENRVDSCLRGRYGF